MPNWNEIRNEYESSKITLKALAEKYDVKIGTLKSRKSREGWSRDPTKKDATKSKVATPKKKVSTKKKQQNRSGNPNPSHKFPNHNSFRTKHGLYSKFLHAEQVEIMQAMEDLNIADQLWFQIEVKFSAIVRMQKIMWVEDAHDHLKEESGSSWGEGGGGESFKVSFAYERYESYIKAQARAMAEYRNLTKQFLELAHEDDERRLKLEQMRLNIEKTKAEIKDEVSTGSRVVIVNDKEAMRKALENDSKND
ncbi:uncharacterized protein YjcR [Bacillus pakistanensis]|uniref:Uncharacterized protein YjcR n=1 Tax=Rossellomorea pakistanensis TaxID=992288 RepID=A0ABS2NDF3_9BACI|nr:phage terminase small subunit [Bacillus pakistanensis]MBM7585835.1 uncharacterized protein YjcR [Bacillus pakistanensis]